MAFAPPDDPAGDPDALAMLARPIAASTRYPAFVEVFLAWAERAPDHVAVEHRGGAWTYRTLRDRAQAIAAVLGQRAARATGATGATDAIDAVAILGAPGPGLVASLLGTLMSGRVMVPLDPEIPAARRAIMMREARVTDVLVVGEVDPGPAGPAGPAGGDANRPPSYLRVDPQTGEIDAPAPHPGLAAREDGPAYVFYTSGTTGEPKGILGTRQGIAHFLHWQRGVVDATPPDRFSHFTGISFDVVLREVLLPLYSGATLVIPDAEAQRSPLAWLCEARITVVHAVPSRVEHWLRRAEHGARLTRVRAVFFAGEPLTASLVGRWRLAAPDSDIINLYGPTETTLAKCFYRVPDEPAAGTQPIGAPLPDTQVFILAEDGSPCARGQLGEIAIRTPFRTLGYVNAPAEQQAKFVGNPRRSDPDDLLYRTGDRGRVRPDGVLEIHGRLDRQIKIRGARVELGEIEAILRKHPDVEQAVTTVTEGTVDRLIIGFVVLSRRSAGTDSLRAFLHGQLPAWMVPSVIVAVDEMPLNHNGKADKRALMARYAERTARRRSAEQAATPTEALVIERVQQLLGVDGVRPQDDFFRLGGDSHRAAQLALRLQRDLGGALTVRLVFETPVIADLARVLDDCGPSDSHDTERIEL
jgi:amino acid adenylation domain-containing protein